MTNCRLKSNARALLLSSLSFLVIPSLTAHEGDPVFVPNLGQWDGDFSHRMTIGDLVIFADDEGFTYLIQESVPHNIDGTGFSDLPLYRNAHVLKLRFHNGNSIAYNGKDAQKAYHNYYLGSDQKRWKPKVPLYSQLRSTEVYPGIHIEASSKWSKFKYDFVVAPGADPAIVEFFYEGADKVSMTGDQLTIETSLGEIFESMPLAYQIINGQQVEIQSKYIRTKNGFGFSFPLGYDTSLPLIIDPILVASTLTGTSSGMNFGHGAAYDIAGNIYTHGISFDSNYPVTAGAVQVSYGGGSIDACISKLVPDGSALIFASFVGGNEGDHPHSIVSNLNNELYVMGSTTSSNLPTTPNAFQSNYGGQEDIFISGFSADGTSLIGSTYMGGSGGDGFNNSGGFGYSGRRGEIIADINGNIYVANCSQSVDFPTTTGAFQTVKSGGQDGVIFKLSPNLSILEWSSFIGSSGGDMAFGVRVKDNFDVVITGGISTSSPGGPTGFPLTSGAYSSTWSGGGGDAFVSIISPDGANVNQSTYLGSSGNDAGLFLDLDSNEDIWIYMASEGQWTTTPGVWGTGQGNILVHKMSGDLSEKLVTSYLSTSQQASGNPVAFMVDLCNNIYISAFGVGNTFVASPDAIISSGGFYVGVFEPDMTDFVYGTYYTGNHVDGGTSRFDRKGIVYQGVCSGGGFNTTSNAFATNQFGSWDVGIFKIDFEIESVIAAATAAGQLSGCAPHTVQFQNYSEGQTFSWTFGDGATSEEFEPSHIFTAPGEYLVQLVVFDPESCNLRDTALIPFIIYPEVDFEASFEYQVDCETLEILFTNTSVGPGDEVYQWSLGDGTLTNEENPVHTYDQTGNYLVVLTSTSAACNQSQVAEEIIDVSPFVTSQFVLTVVDFCDSFTVGVINQTNNADTYNWNMGDGTFLNSNENFEYTYSTGGTQTIELIAFGKGTCNESDTLILQIEFPEPPILNPEITISQIGSCNQLEFLASVNPNGPVDSIQWYLNGIPTSLDLIYEGQATIPGAYLVQVEISDPVCQNVFTANATVELVSTLGIEFPPSVVICHYEDGVELDATSIYDDATYLWNGGLSQEPVIFVTESGEYEIVASYRGCVESDVVNISQGVQLPLFFIDSICTGVPTEINFNDEFEIIENVSWDNGQEGFVFLASEPGYYPFVATDILGCNQNDSLLVNPLDDDPNLEIPNVFTPNGDGRNDEFRINGEPLDYFNLTIIDRWGRSVFETDQVYQSWDGIYTEGSGEKASNGSFVYILKYRDQCAQSTMIKTGYITLLE